MAFTPLILAHVLTAGGAVVLGAATLALPKGTTLHRLFGRLWVGLMATTALISFGIRHNGAFSPVHLLSVLALAGLAAAVLAAVRGHVRAHRRAMLAVYISLLVAGTFTLLPERLLGRLLWQAVGLA